MGKYERVCPVCGRIFYIGKADDWTYRVKRQIKGRKYCKMFCTNRCMAAWLQEVQDEAQREDD